MRIQRKKKKKNHMNIGNIHPEMEKNIPACQQYWCKFFPSSGKMCAKFYTDLWQK